MFVVIGAPNHTRMSYKLWEEPKAPDFVLEITSRSTRAEDQGRKREVYASLGVGEYWLFDPTGDWLAPRLKGFRLHEGVYRPLPSVALVNGGYSLHSETLGLEVRLDEDRSLRLHDPETGEDLHAHEEMRERVEEEITARRSAEARLDETEARLDETETRLDETETRLDETETRLDETETRLDETETRLRETRLRLDEEAAGHRATRARLEEEIAARDARVAKLEARLRRTSGTG